MLNILENLLKAILEYGDVLYDRLCTVQIISPVSPLKTMTFVL